MCLVYYVDAQYICTRKNARLAIPWALGGYQYSYHNSNTYVVERAVDFYDGVNCFSLSICRKIKKFIY